MPTEKFPPPTRVLTEYQARRFLLAHQRLWPPRSLVGKEGLLDFIRHVGCIQFDPINVVGRNPDLVLQARIADYQPQLLESLLYEERRLWDGWDKQASIYAVEDWPNFQRRRDQMGMWHKNSDRGHMPEVDDILATVVEQGPLSSLELKDRGVIDWAWGRPASVARAALETLYERGSIGVSHRVGSRRYYDPVDRLVTSDLLACPDPHQSLEDYQAWHILRRIGGLGLASMRAGEYWLGILGVQSRERRPILVRLIEEGSVEQIRVEGLPRETFFIRQGDMVILETLERQSAGPAKAAFLAPLDNFLWDRRRLKDLFGFEYKWEVYTPAKDRKYGYYVLPVLYGDQLVARVDFGFDKREHRLTLVNWWWESGVNQGEELEYALLKCLKDFYNYLQVDSFHLGNQAREKSLAWAEGLVA
jgi:uncharacterized protein YcaQ